MGWGRWRDAAGMGGSGWAGEGTDGIHHRVPRGQGDPLGSVGWWLGPAGEGGVVAGRHRAVEGLGRGCPGKLQKGKLGCTKGCKGTSGEQQGHIGGGCSRASWDALGMQWDRRDAWREAATLAGTCWGMAQIRAEPHWGGGAAESTGVMLQRWRECTEVGRMHRQWQRCIGWSNALEMRGCTGWVQQRQQGFAGTGKMHWRQQGRNNDCGDALGGGHAAETAGMHRRRASDMARMRWGTQQRWRGIYQGMQTGQHGCTE